MQKVLPHFQIAAKHGFNAAGEISANVYGVTRHFLVETGAQRSAISDEAFLKLPKSCQKTLTSDIAKLFGANKNPLHVQGVVELDLD